MLFSAFSAIAPPMWSIPGAAVTAFQLVSIATSFSNEANPESRVAYSKFFHDKKQQESDKPQTEISSRTGMTIIYGLPFVAAVSSISTTTISLAGTLVALHFLKRLLEVQFVHSYSGGMAGATALMIGTYYALTAALICNVATDTPTEASTIWGTGLFIVGSLGNLYHHMLLAKLRQNMTDSYVVPSGGLFEFVAAPHYFFELMAWLGIAVASQHGTAYLVFASMSSYLAGRSVSQNAWNHEKFAKEWPVSRKNMVPFVF